MELQHSTESTDVAVEYPQAVALEFAEPARRRLAIIDQSRLRRDCLKLALAQQPRRWLVTDVPAAADLVRLMRGGEEFAVILPNTDTTSASVVAERIRVSMMERAQNVDSPTVSIGVASVHPRPDRNPAALIKAADTALYRAKANGRNRCETLIAAATADAHAPPVGV